jgi:hypothetical protein
MILYELHNTNRLVQMAVRCTTDAHPIIHADLCWTRRCMTIDSRPAAEPECSMNNETLVQLTKGQNLAPLEPQRRMRNVPRYSCYTNLQRSTAPINTAKNLDVKSGVEPVSELLGCRGDMSYYLTAGQCSDV